MANTVNLTIRMDKQLKQEMETLSHRLGMSISGLLNVFATGFVRTKKVPAEYMDAGPSAELLKALDESNTIMAELRSGQCHRQGYRDLDAMWAALDQPDDTKEPAHATAR